MKVNEIDWSQWEPEESATLMFVIKDQQVLLIRKKRGLGAGKINGPGGRIEPGETPLECAIRETREELLIEAKQVSFAAELFFHAEDFPKIHAHVFIATDFDGTPTETDEAVPIWYDLNKLPVDEMWSDDRYWLPRVLAGEKLRGRFTFEGEDVVDFSVTTV